MKLKLKLYVCWTTTTTANTTDIDKNQPTKLQTNLIQPYLTHPIQQLTTTPTTTINK